VSGAHPSTATQCYIQTIGTAVPERSFTSEQTVAAFKAVYTDPRSHRLLRRIVRLTGIENRYLAALDFLDRDDNETPLYLPAEELPGGPGMGARNSRFAEASASLVRQAVSEVGPRLLAAVDTLVTVSCTHASAPGLEAAIYDQAVVRPAVHRWNLGFMGCSGGLAALRLVRELSPRGRTALIVTCELSSLHFQYSTDLDQMTANVLFADGAAAAIVSSERSAVRVVDCRCAALPEAADQMIWFADDRGLRLRLSQDLPDTLAAALPEAVASFLGENGLATAGVQHWLVHPGGPQILDSAGAALNLAPQALELSRSVLRRYGNMSSSTILFILRELIEKRAEGTCVALAFGPGLTIEMALLELSRDGAVAD
jgi:prepilin-type processing-associated H-X9-DG protein